MNIENIKSLRTRTVSQITGTALIFISLEIVWTGLSSFMHIRLCKVSSVQYLFICQWDVVPTRHMDRQTADWTGVFWCSPKTLWRV